MKITILRNELKKKDLLIYNMKQDQCLAVENAEKKIKEKVDSGQCNFKQI